MMGFEAVLYSTRRQRSLDKASRYERNLYVTSYISTCKERQNKPIRYKRQKLLVRGLCRKYRVLDLPC